MYKINLHTHTYFSDGYNSPIVMAQGALALGFTSLCITDHFSINKNPQRHQEFGSYPHEMAIREARKVLPIILGMEVYVEGQEMLVFGGELTKAIRSHRNPITIKQMKEWRKDLYCAMILCHPGAYTTSHTRIVDGYERYNSGSDYFKDERVAHDLTHLPHWSNSDAHMVSSLDRGWNLVDTKITNESELIKYIKRGKQPQLVAQGKEV